jgi:hypothetical protein
MAVRARFMVNSDRVCMVYMSAVCLLNIFEETPKNTNSNNTLQNQESNIFTSLQTKSYSIPNQTGCLRNNHPILESTFQTF